MSVREMCILAYARGPERCACREQLAHGVFTYIQNIHHWYVLDTLIPNVYSPGACIMYYFGAMMYILCTR